MMVLDIIISHRRDKHTTVKGGIDPQTNTPQSDYCQLYSLQRYI